MKKHDFFYGVCTVNLSKLFSYCFYMGVVCFMENTYDILWEQKIVYRGPSAQFNVVSCGVAVILCCYWKRERDLKSRLGNRLCLECPVCQLSFLWKTLSGFLHYALVQQLTTVGAGWSGHNGWLTLNTM